MSMTKNEGRQAAISHRDIRILSSYAWFPSPRRIEMVEQKRREKMWSRRIRHGIARAIEDLRGLRLSLVPGPDPRECLLQGM